MKKRSKFGRRDLLKAGIASLPVCALSRSLEAMARSAAGGNPNRRLLTIFLRGANDGVNTVIPHGDGDYAMARQTIGLTTTQSLSLTNYPGIGLHPAMTGLKALFDQGSVALLHRVGNLDGKRSHFNEQHLLETGRLDYTPSAKGWVPQALSQIPATGLLPSLSLSNRMQRMYLSSDATDATFHLQEPYVTNGNSRDLSITFANPGNPPTLTPAVRVANRVEATSASGAGAYAVTGEGPFLRSTIQASIDKLRQLRLNHSSFPHNGIAFPTKTGDPNVGGNPDTSKYYKFFARVEEAVYMLNSGVSTFAGVELGGWDTHANQTTVGQMNGSVTEGQHATLLEMLSHAIMSAKRSMSSDSLILVVTEFGRTNRDNGSGTDHGVGALYIVVGDLVNGGVYNCWLPAMGGNPAMGQPKGAQWKQLLSTPSAPEYFDAIEPATDFRVPLIEIMTKFFQMPATDLMNFSEVGAEWDMIYNNPTGAFAPLNFL